jgi:hypothetical protein
MANNYTQFSEEISNLTQEEKDWIVSVLEVPINDTQESFYLKDWEGPGFEWSFEDKRHIEPSHTYNTLWIYTEESGNIDNVAEFIQAFIKKFRPSYIFTISWADTCSKPRIHEFGGGAAVIDANHIRCMNTDTWLKKTVITLENGD